MRCDTRQDNPLRVTILVLVTTRFLCASLAVHGQHWSDGLLPGADWELAKARFDSTWADSLAERGKGIKPFMRWWHFAESRWAFDGADQPEHAPFRSDAPWRETAAERAGRAARMDSIPSVWSKATPPGIPDVGGAGRVNRVVIHPTDTATWLACAPSGGAWASTNSGRDWTLLGTADWAGMGVSDAAFHPDDPLDLMVATGDSDFGSAYGVGLMRSTDGGASWMPTALAFDLSETHTVSRVHRKAGTPSHILAATSDGVWVSEDDGETFTNTLNGLCSDLVPHPGDSSVWYALLRPGEVNRSTDGGWNWAPVSGLPDPFGISRMALAVSPLAHEEVWVVAARASTQGLDGVFFSADSGQTFTELPDVPNLLGYTVAGTDFGGQGFYDLTIAVDPLDADHVVVGGVNLWSTEDHGGQWQCIGHWFGADSVPEVHADHHAITFLPGTSDWVSAHDGGVARFSDGSATPTDRSDGLDIAQVYRVGFTDERPDRLLAGWQDNGINVLKDGVHARVRGADGFHCMFTPGHPDTVYAAEYFGRTFRSQDAGWSWTPWIASNGSGVEEKGDWDTPMAFSPANPERAFVAKRRLYWSDDGGENWSQTPALPGGALEMLALSPVSDQVAVVGRSTLAHRTTDLESWTLLQDLPGLPVLDAVMDPADDETIWLAFGGYDADARVRRSEDGGLTWAEEGSGLPALPVNTLVRDDVNGDLYAGTDAGVYVLPSASDLWIPYKAGLPEVLCSDLAIRRSTGELLLSTYGRGLWKAPLHSIPNRDAAAIRILGGQPTQCGRPPTIRLAFRNAGADTLVAATIGWASVDTLSYGFVLPPNQTVHLPWTGAPANALNVGDILEARILSIVGVEGDVQHGSLVSTVDAVAENDVARTRWAHQSASGLVIIETEADCHPLESAWEVLNDAGISVARRQHFTPEAVTRDSLCLTHGCHPFVLHDAEGDGFAGADCGMEGSLSWVSFNGPVIWSMEGSFSQNQVDTLCLPAAGVSGCTDPTACNFDPTATESNGACIYGCPNPNCPSDLDGDGVHGASDILDVLSQYGCTSSCALDVTGDGVVSANDILFVLALYGQSCFD